MLSFEISLTSITDNLKGYGMMGKIPILIFFFLLLSGICAQESKIDKRYLGTDNSNDGSCRECHEVSVKIWQESKHFSSWKAPDSKKGQEIKARLKSAQVKEISCQKCHATEVWLREEQTKKTIGVSCESCHNPSQDWVKWHRKYKKNKEQNKQKAIKNGFLRPRHSMYEIAKKCFECHLVPQENLVSIGQHPTGKEFELVSWLHGEVLHNVLILDRNRAGQKKNRETSSHRKRMIYILGKLIEFEEGLRQYAFVSEKESPYEWELGRRILKSYQDLKEIREFYPSTANPKLETLKEIVRQLPLRESSSDIIQEAADQVSKLTKIFYEEYEQGNRSLADLPELSEEIDNLILRLRNVGSKVLGQ